MKRNLPRFLYGFLSSSAEPINMKVPWAPSDRNGLFKMNYSTIDAERDNLICWALTNRGERVMDFSFGLDARRYLFDPAPIIRDNLINNARDQLKKYFPHLIVEQLQVLTWEEDKTLDANTARFILKVRLKNQNVVIGIDEVLK